MYGLSDRQRDRQTERQTDEIHRYHEYVGLAQARPNKTQWNQVLKYQP